VDGLSVRMALCFANGGASRDLGLKILRVQGKGGPNRPRKWARPAGLGRPAQAHPGPARSPLRSRGSSCDYDFAPSICTILTMPSSRLRWRFSVHEFRSVTFQSLPPLEVISSSSCTRTRLCNCSFEFVVNPSFMSMFSYINITLSNACTKMNLLYD
jgi:hypothetical protein